MKQELEQKIKQSSRSKHKTWTKEWSTEQRKPTNRTRVWWNKREYWKYKKEMSKIREWKYNTSTEAWNFE